MISIGLIVLISVDLILLTYGKYKLYYVSIKKMIKTMKENNNKKNNANLDKVDVSNVTVGEVDIDQVNIKKTDSLVRKILGFIIKIIVVIIVGILLLAFIIIMLGVSTSSIWATILIAVWKNFISATIFLFVIKLFYFLIGLCIHKTLKVDKSVTKRVLIMDAIQFCMLSLVLYFAAFGFPIQIIDMVIIPYWSDITFNNLVSIMLPMLFFSIIVVNVLAVAFRLKNIFIKNREKHKLIRLHQLLFIFIASCYIGILYITDINIGFMNEFERIMYLQTLEVLKWIITSVFIPLFLYTISNYKKSKTVIRLPRRRTSSR